MLSDYKSARNRKLLGVIAALAFVAVFTFFSVPSEQWSTISDRVVPTRKPMVNITAALSHTPPHFKGTYFTIKHGQDWNQPVVGIPTTEIGFDDSEIIDVRTGEPFVYSEGHTFNLAVLRLPPGSDWDYVGVARGPTFVSDFMIIAGAHSRQQSLIGIGLKLGKNGQLTAVTDGERLDLPMFPNPACESTGHWAATFGPEDPRLFWTDAGTPGFTLGRMASIGGGSCRDIGFIPDLRSVFPALAVALKPGHGVAAFDGTVQPGEVPAKNHELVRLDEQSLVEKNWVSFYPGAKPNGDLYPHIHYLLAPDLALRPVRVSQRKVEYEDMESTQDQQCIHTNHNGVGAHELHQATPFYRLTLCDRGCVPDDTNTVYLTLAHVDAYPTYGKFFATYSVTAPHEPLSVGPVLSIRGVNEDGTINYVLALQPVTEVSKTRGRVLPDHFFLDDSVLVTMGHQDSSMTSTIVEMSDVLGGHRLCE